MRIVLDEEGYCIEGAGVDSLATVDDFLALHHLVCNDLDQVLISGAKVNLEIFS